MENSKFRELLSTPREEAGSSKPKADPAAAAAKRAKAKESYERRMEIQKQREAALAEKNKYRDRALERRKEGGGDDAAERAEIDAASLRLVESVAPGLGAQQADPAESLPSAPTFAQGGHDLAAQAHRVTIDQSKFLGGDIEHTHLVKGLDFALLQKMRSELAADEAAKSPAAVGAPPRFSVPSKKPAEHALRRL